VKVDVETCKYPPGEQLYRDIWIDQFYNWCPTALVPEADFCFFTYNVVRGGGSRAELSSLLPIGRKTAGALAS
jgi:hypothetical protein